MRAADRLLVVLFLIGIWLPLAGLVLGLDSSFVLNENRRLAERPCWSRDLASLARFPGRFEAYFNDRFGFRKRLIRWLSIVKVEAMGISSSPASVLVGRRGWLFYTDCGAYDYYRGTDPFNREQLAAWAKMFQERHDWLAERGIRYLVVVAPNKDTIYPELMPGSVNRVRWRSRLDQLTAYLRDHTTVSVVDLKEPMLRAKAQDILYFRTDTHWNTRGGYVAYREILGALSAWFPALAPLPPSDFHPHTFPSLGGDLAGMLGLADRLPEVGYDLSALVPRSARRQPAECRMPPGVPEFQLPFAMECGDPRLPRAIMFRDSFSGAILPLISEHFRRIVYAWKYTLDRDLVERERPDVVIQELVERALMWNLPEYRESEKAPATRIWSYWDPTAR